MAFEKWPYCFLLLLRWRWSKQEFCQITLQRKGSSQGKIHSEKSPHENTICVLHGPRGKLSFILIKAHSHQVRFVMTTQSILLILHHVNVKITVTTNLSQVNSRNEFVTTYAYLIYC